MLRRLAPWLVLVTLLGFTAVRTHTVLADSVVSSTATVTSPDGLNLRSGPGTSASVIAVMPNGAVVTLTGNGTADNWLPVQYNGLVGWADGAYLAVTPGTPTPTPQAIAATAPQPASTTATVLPPDGLNLRSGPDSNAGIMTVIPGGTGLTISGAAQGQWVPVTLNGANGWVDAAYISTNGSSPVIVANASTTTAGASVSAAAGSSPATAANLNASTPPATAASASSGSAAATTLAWPNDSRKITTVFSPAHLGIDIDQFPNGSKFAVNASAAGTVTFAGGDSCCSYGLYIIVDHGNGLSTLYAHFSSLGVQKGQVVNKGQKLGQTGCTGKCTGDHIHFEVHVNGTPVDPLRYLPSPWTIE